ncbi:MAG: hypothetical protein ACLQB4_05990 [Beijerinckiaceae bacterium]
MIKTSTTSRPTHRVYAVRKGANDKGYWTEIGAAWAHQDSKGFNVKLDYLPLNGAEIVIREPQAKGSEGGAQ